jgi:hypothetical protein
MAIPNQILQQFWRNLDKLREPFDKRNEVDIRKTLYSQQKSAMQQIIKADSTDEMIRIAERWEPDKQMDKTIEKLYRNTGGYFANVQIDMYRQMLKHDAEMERKDEDLLNAFAAFESEGVNYYDYMQNFASEFVGDKITLINQTTKKQLVRATKAAVQEGINEGYGIEKIGKLIREKTGITNRYRALRIARTETASAQSNGTQAVANDMNIPQYKVWLSAPATPGHRPEHQQYAIEPKLAEMNQPFIVAGEEMQHPHDVAASGGNVINCRCGHSFIPKSRAREFNF